MYLNYIICKKMSGTGSEYLIATPQKSFFGNKHLQHFNVLSRKEIYNFQNNRVVLPNNTELEKIDKMWISNVDNVKCISMFLVLYETTDIDTITTDIANVNDKNNLHTLFRLTNSAIATYNSLHSEGKYSNALPCVSGSGIMPSRYNFGKTRVLIVVERYKPHIQTDLTIKYLTSNDFEEKKRIFQEYQVTLVRKYISYEHNCKIGTNKIKFDCPNRCVYYIIINSAKNQTIKFVCNTFNNQREITTIKHEILSTRSDEEFKYLSINNTEYNFNTYILDAYMNTQHLEYQPTGIIEILNGSYFDIFCGSESQITITYCLHDVLVSTWGAQLSYV